MRVLVSYFESIFSIRLSPVGKTNCTVVSGTPVEHRVLKQLQSYCVDASHLSEVWTGNSIFSIFW